MAKLRTILLLVAAGGLALPAVSSAGILGPQPALCSAGAEPSILVRVSGLKNRAGKLRVRTFTGNPANYFDRTKTLQRFEYVVPAVGPIDVCVPVPAPGVYALDVRHDVNNNSDTDRADGIGASGNPKMTLFSIIFGRRPPAAQVQFRVGSGTAVVPVVVRYL